MRNICVKCQTSLGLEERIVCGFCDGEFHLPCASVNAFALFCCRENDHLLWFCNECLPKLKNYREMHSTPTNSNTIRDESEKSLETAVESMQEEIGEMKKCLAELQGTLSLSLNRSTRNPTLTSTPKENVTERSRCSSSSKLDDSAHTKLCNGSRIVDGNSNRPDNSLFWIFLTGIANHVSENDISELVCKCLPLQRQPIVKKLVPCWRNVNDMSFISFKVGVSCRHRESALLDSTWPIGIRFREFKDHSMSPWQP